MDDNYPAICFEVGLTCEACTEGTAAHLARCCKGLRGKAIGQLFMLIHPHPACAPMHAHFAKSYRAGAAGTMAEETSLKALAASAGA